MENKSMKIKYDSDHISNNMFFERKSITIKYGSGLNKNIFLVLLIEQVWIMSPPTFLSCPSVRHTVCQRNSSETTEQNFMKLGR